MALMTGHAIPWELSQRTVTAMLILHAQAQSRSIIPAGQGQHMQMHAILRLHQEFHGLRQGSALTALIRALRATMQEK